MPTIVPNTVVSNRKQSGAVRGREALAHLKKIFKIMTIAVQLFSGTSFRRFRITSKERQRTLQSNKEADESGNPRF